VSLDSENVPSDVDMDTGEWAFFEVRPRDPSFLTATNAAELKGSYVRAECCWDAEAWIVEIPRARRVGSKMIEVPPARLRLCHYHMQTVLTADPEASAFPLGCQP
jgi:hypothetical protein